MEIELILFGVVRDIAKQESCRLTLEPPYTVGQLKNALCTAYPATEKLASLMVAVNQEYASDGMVVSQKDEVAIIPPVSGG